MKKILLACLSALTLTASADVKLPAVFGDHMVLQRDRTIPVWGFADAGEGVTVAFAGQEKKTTAKPDGTWRVDLDALPANAQGAKLLVKGNNAVEIQDVLVGEVWICGGQSNMEWKLENSSDAQKFIAESGDPQLRLFRVEHAVADKPQQDCRASWAFSDPTTVPQFSAVGFHFGKILRKELSVPVGLVQSTWGGTPAEAWTSEPALREGSRFEGIYKRIELWKQTAPDENATYEKQLAAWEEASKKAKSQGLKAPRKPAQPKSTRQQLYPSTLFNAMIAPLTPFASRGVIWYQGEANAERANQYRTLLPTLIKDWRRAFENEALPFGIVQLANYGPVYPKPIEPSVWCELRDAQLQTAREVPHTGLALAIDIGDPENIHPQNKIAVGRRLSLWALAKVYNQPVEYSGPIYKEQKLDGSKIRLIFDHAKGLRTTDGGQLKGFVISGDDERFVAAEALIEGNEIVVSAPQVKNPVAVRYAWMKNPPVNLVNGAGLPASPFKTDMWADKTVGEE